MCASSTELLKAGAANAGSSLSCVVGLSGGSWLASVKLNNQTAPANYCVDHTGFAGELTSAPSAVAITGEVKCK
jgi:hypothetical protein